MSLRAKILVIDDDRSSVAVMEELLGSEFTLLTANSSQEGLAIAGRERPDLILLNVAMPDTDGYETCRRIRSTADLAQTKVLLLSDPALASKRIRSYEAGAEDHITKPFDGAELRAKVGVYLRLKGAAEIEKMKDGLLDLLAHEIRTPLTAILPATEMLNGDYALSEEDRHMLLHTIRDGARRLLRLTERASVLQRARAGGLQLRRRNVDLAELLRAAIPNAPAIRLGINEPAMVFGDATLLTLAIEELINHACLHTEAPVIQLLGGGANDAARIRISYVGDQLLTSESLQALTPLSDDVRDGQTVGAHLGLPTAVAILTAHGGSLWIVPGADELCGLEARLPTRQG